jgi:putative DNA methylase
LGSIALAEKLNGTERRTARPANGNGRGGFPMSVVKTAFTCDEGEPLRMEGGAAPTFLESGFPFRELSLVARADQRRATDPVYASHRWWARRPPSVIRGLILAAALPSSTSTSEFWKIFASSAPVLAGRRVHDLFAGGGAILVEAARLGAIPSGTDIDPLAIKIIEHELNPPSCGELDEAGAELLEFVEAATGRFYAATKPGWTPLHYFYLYEVSCPLCHTRSPLFRNLVIARDRGRDGGVVRSAPIVAFCPDCFSIHQLAEDRKELRCCKKRRLTDGTFANHRFTCPQCGHCAGHRELQTATMPRRLIAVEETRSAHMRRIRAASKADLERTRAADRYLAAHAKKLQLPRARLTKQRTDPRPLSFGIRRPVDLFTSRQLVVFGTAFRWLRASRNHSQSVRRALTLALSNALTTNNRLCGYATDYGRLAPLFSVRSYALPALSVELNPLHPSAGRGTLRRNLGRLSRSTADQVRRFVWSPIQSKAIPVMMNFSHRTREAEVLCASAGSKLSSAKADIDICVFDPPYFDYIAYSELSEFYRCWLDDSLLGGQPLLPKPEDPSKSFGCALGDCLRAALRRLKQGRPIAFTYHSAHKPAWDAIGIALDKATLYVTALWPVQNDSHMGHHGADGNCEWDMILVCRRRSECGACHPQFALDEWSRVLDPLKIGPADRLSMCFAADMARARFGVSRTNTNMF